MLLACLIEWTVRLSDIIGWFVVASITAIVYWRFQRRQIRITRYSIVRQLEEDIVNLFRSKTVFEETVPPLNINDSSNYCEFRVVLDNRPPWTFEEDKTISHVISGKPSAKFKLINGQRFWLIRTITKPDNTQVLQYLASCAFQETLLWFRRVERARKDTAIVTEDELLDLWRFILPMGFAGRLNYFSKYFQGPEDIRSIVIVINATLRAALEFNQRVPLEYFNDDLVTKEDLSILTFDKTAQKLHQKVKNQKKSENIR